MQFVIIVISENRTRQKKTSEKANGDWHPVQGCKDNLPEAISERATVSREREVKENSPMGL